MGRIRTIKPEFFKHEDLYLAEKETKLPLRVAFAGLWCCADREGRFKWKPNVLKLDVLPFDNCDFAKVLDALCVKGWVRKYSLNGQQYGDIPTFSSHQVVNNRERASELPNYSESIDSTREGRGNDATTTSLIPAQVEGKGMEGAMGKEGEREVAITPTYSEEDLKRWEVFKKWMATSADRVATMQKPITMDQFLELRIRFGAEHIRDMFLRMQNWKKLSNNVSAYLTYLNWVQLDEKRGTKVADPENPFEGMTKKQEEDIMKGLYP